MSIGSRSVGKIKTRKKDRTTADPSPLVYSIEEIRRLLGVGRGTAYEVARNLGKRVGGKRRGRLIVSRHALESWLDGEAGQ